MRRFDEKYIASVLTFEKSAAAAVFDQRVREIDEDARLSYVEVGLIANAMEESELFRFVVDPKTGEGFSSMDRWILDAAPVSRASVYAAKGALIRLKENGVPLDEVRKMKRGNIESLSRLSGSLQRDAGIIAAAQTKEPEAFIAKIEAEHPEEHMEGKMPMRFKPTKSQRKVIQAALDGVMLLEGLTSREEGLEVLSVSWLLGHQQRLEQAMQERARAANA